MKGDDGDTSSASDGIPCMLMRGGASKGAYFLSGDLPADPLLRNDLLLRIMGSPDRKQIDGLGGAHPHTSKVAIIARSQDPEADIDYLFLQVQVTEAIVTDQQTCGNLLAGVAPFAIERGLHPVTGDATDVRIRVLNDGALVIATVHTPNGQVSYAGDSCISGVPFPAAAIPLRIAADDRAVLASGKLRDLCDGAEVTCVDAGKPFVLIRAADLGVTGHESPTELDENERLRKRLESIRVIAGRAMGLGDVSGREEPKLAIVAPARSGGAISARIFTPHRCHPSIGVLGAISVAAGLRIQGSVVESARPVPPAAPIRIEHPSGYFDVDIRLQLNGARLVVGHIAVLQTARKIFDGRVWPRESAARPHLSD